MRVERGERRGKRPYVEVHVSGTSQAVQDAKVGGVWKKEELLCVVCVIFHVVCCVVCRGGRVVFLLHTSQTYCSCQECITKINKLNEIKIT